MKKSNLVILILSVCVLFSQPAFGQTAPDLDYSVEMPSIDRIEGSMAVPANFDLLMQGILKIFADSDDDGNVSQIEADALWDSLSDEQKANMSLRLEDLEPLIEESIGIDFDEPISVEVLAMELKGLVGPVNSSTPLAFVITFNAEFDVSSTIIHTISFGIDETYEGDVDFEFIAPSGWEVDRVSGLTGLDIDGREVHGTPHSQVNIRISEDIGDQFVILCLILIIVGIVIVITIIFILVRISQKKKEAKALEPPGPSMAAPLSSEFAMACAQCGGHATYVPQYQKYYCNNCEKYCFTEERN
jgi:hypothetical protein